MDPLERSYETHPYPQVAHYQTRPVRLQGIAALHGLQAPSPARCRVLELGCGTGGNLLPMAEALPGTTFLGLDFSEPQIARAKDTASAAGLGNLEFRRADFRDPLGELGEFDYILAHGLISWVPVALQDRILGLCQDHLAPDGIAYLSFNCLPGWHLNLWLRDLLRFAHEATGEVAKARNFAALVGGSPALEPELRTLLQKKLSALPAGETAYLVHDFLEAENHPLTFLNFHERTKLHGLQYLADAESNLVLQDDGSAISLEVRAIAGSFERREQCLDFIRHRQFRRALLCRAERSPEREGLAERLAGLSLLSRLREVPGTPGRFQGHGAETGLALGDPRLVAAFRRLQESYPAAVPFQVLRDVVPQGAQPGFAEALLTCWRMGALEVQAEPDAFPSVPQERPRISAAARFADCGEGRVHALNLTPVELPAALFGLLPAMDGSRSAAELADLALQRGIFPRTTHPSPVEVQAELLRFGQWCGRNALLPG